MAVLFSRKKCRQSYFVDGLCGGIMVAAAVWSLLIPSIELGGDGALGIIPAVIGLSAGVTFFLLCDRAIEKRVSAQSSVALDPSAKRTVVSCLAVILHNFPEGMAVGAIFADAVYTGSTASMSAAMALSVGIAVQNIPEGAIVSMPLYASGSSRRSSLLIGALSGSVEPVGAILTMALSSIAIPCLPYMLSFAAGAMIYAFLDALSAYGRLETQYAAGFCAGFSLMMSLDVLLG